MSVSAVYSGEMLTAAQFQDELRRAGRFCSRAPIVDPLAAAVKMVEQSPACAQSRVITRLMAALGCQHGDFRRADVSALDGPGLTLVIALMDAYTAGTSTREELTRAAEAAKAAEIRA